MYDKLIESLRLCVKYDNAMDALMNAEQAADAIEQLSEYADTIRRLKYEGWYLQQIKFHDGYQAIATMQLPILPKEVT